MTTLTFFILPDGKLPHGIKDTLARLIPSMAGKKVNLSLIEAKEKRSLDQNSYYWGVIVPHVRQVRFDMGDPLSPEKVHEDLLVDYAPLVDAKTLTGKSYKRPMRSKEMSVDQMAQYITAISAVMAQFGNPIPLQEYTA